MPKHKPLETTLKVGQNTSLYRDSIPTPRISNTPETLSQGMRQMTKPVLTQRQIRTAIKEGMDDAEDAVNDSHDSTAPDGGWDSWLINSIGPSRVAKLSGTTIDSPAWQLWLQIYHEAACLSAENTLLQIKE